MNPKFHLTPIVTPKHWKSAYISRAMCLKRGLAWGGRLPNNHRMPTNQHYTAF